jgi:hypothetical protein
MVVFYVLFVRWYFAITSLSGVMAVTFSIVFAYVADITTKEERGTAYGLVSFRLGCCCVWFWFHAHHSQLL